MRNLLVPVCLSASHIAYGSIRMEPVFMVLGQSAATAACQAIDRGAPIQRIDVSTLQARLKADGQVLEWTGPARATSRVDVRSLPGLVLDDTDAKLTGNWAPSSALGGFIGSGYMHDSNAGQRSKDRPLRPRPPGGGPLRSSGGLRRERQPSHQRPYHCREPRRSDDVPRQPETRARPGLVVLCLAGHLPVEEGKRGAVVIANEGTDGHVIVDAVQCLPVK